MATAPPAADESLDATIEEVALQTYSFPLISIIRTAQGQNGVIHGDFSRYRRHCKNKLQALYKTLKFQHGRTKFIKRKVEVKTVTDVRFLHIPLFNAERAWAYAKEFKKQIEGNMDLKKRRHLIARMQKAAAWAKDLARLAVQRCDPRGCLEAQAYAAFVTGTAISEREKSWGQALALLTRARYILTALSRLGGTTETQALYLQQVEDIEPAIRYCTYQLSRQGAAEPSESQLLAQAEKEDFSLPSAQVSAHLSSLAQEGAGVVEVAAATTLEWRGQSVAVRNDRLKAAVHQVHQVEADLSTCMESSPGEGAAGSDPRIQILEKLLKALADARTAARLAIKASTAPEGDPSRVDLTDAEAALTGLIAQRQVELAELQVADAEVRFVVGLEAKGVGAAKKGAGKERREGCRPEEVVRLLDGLQRSLMELADVGAKAGGRQGEALYDLATAKSACARASRAYYTSHYLLAQSKPLEAYALFGRAAEYAQAAKQENPPQTDAERLTAMLKSITVFQSVAQAEHAAQAAHKRESVEASVGVMGLNDVSGGGQTAGGGNNKWLLESLDTWESFVSSGKAPRVYRLPFVMQAFPCRPIMLDTASSHLEYPDLSHRLKKQEKKSVLSSLGLGWAWGAKK